ncbi:methyl-accepting chemotaxis protein [uncultured Desulfobacter sp.]|uniref:methyl-accepting chemotaxis protein n=1 Tax=uncultured Desulfobacter sp. TaxID=240139 RepID=UPI0029F5A8F8|nr:methyl-accepting chemotaxis protein [uncultured Desulfobacter sp.]
MTVFNNMKIGTRLLIGFATMILFMAGIGFCGLYSVNQIEQRLEEIFSKRLPSIDYLLEADRDLQQLLVAERSMIFANPKSDLFKNLVNDYEANLKQAAERWEKYKVLADKPEEKALFSDYEKAREAWKVLSRKIVDGRIADTRQGRRIALDLSLGDANEKFEAMRDYLDQLTGINLAQATSERNQATTTYKFAVKVIFAAIGVGLLFGIALMLVIGRSVTRPLKEVVKGLFDISEGDGDLTKRLKKLGKNEIGDLCSAFNQFMDKQQLMISDISKSVATLAESSQDLIGISQTLSTAAEMATKTSESVNDAAAAMSQNMDLISTSTQESSSKTATIASAAEEMNATVGEIAKNAEQGREISANAVSRVEESSSRVGQLGEAAQAISKVVETITDISEQVNLLSLNATIEAARAGEAGKGFAVVANEIKTLAGQTAGASMDIKEKIGHIQETSNGTLESIDQIREVINQVDQVVTTIATAVEEQSSVTHEIADNISQVSTGIEDVNRNVLQSSESAENITGQIQEVNKTSLQVQTQSGRLKERADGLAQIAADLNSLVGRFKF